ncbi:MAG: hypothetical protein ACI4NG_01130, partial [Candidatus Gallimonas sp.]
MKRGFFSFDNTGGEYASLGNDLRRGVPAAAFGVSDEQKYLIAAMCERRAVYITADALTAKRAAASISALSGKTCALLTAKDEVLSYRKALSKDALFSRLTALWQWERGADVLVCDAEAAIQLFPRRVPSFRLEVGKERELGALVSELTAAGYVRGDSVESRGSFAVRGDILDIFPVNTEHPVRVDFFGDEVEAIKPYDENTGERLPTTDEIELVAATDAAYSEGDAEEIRRVFSEELRLAPSADALSRMRTIASEITEGEGVRSDFVMPLLNASCDLFSVIDDDALLIFDESKLIKDKLDGLYREHGERWRALYEGGETMRFSVRQYAEREDFL